MFLLESI